MGFFRRLVGFAAGEAVAAIKDKVDEAIEDIEERVERATKKVMKVIVLYLMILIGAVFMLVGLAKYLTDTVPHLAHGLGFVLVGAVLVVLALFARLMK